ncbi:polycystic kidney disease protein 1-like 1 [Rana temporaria]|uniref:polycystic kidney disease protein 1-like 1 n=1 Tax=Rana temporaria TaxID=8407 RepID=UPI001AADE926|nr:polycystic kidney disease protein 1-like 1 [Rana temporaria]
MYFIFYIFYFFSALYILTNGTVFSTETYINFTAVTKEFGPLEFIWQFADRPPERTTRRSIIKRFNLPNMYSVVVKTSNKFHSFTSDVHTIFVQRKVIPNRLVASPSVLINSNVSFYCRINSGTNVSYFWDFGDGTKRLGKYNDTHVYRREGEYTVNVSIFNNVSSAFLTKQIFVVKEPCQPPPVKNMGPLKLQIRRYEDLFLGVTFEATVICNISQGLKYHWSFMKTDGTFIFLPAHVENSKQTITLPAFSLDYGNYTALARVQIIGTVVYSNYSVAVEVQPTVPVSVLANGHHLYIDKTTVEYFILDGTASFDPDNPGNPLRFFWDCTPLTKQHHSCFNADVHDPLQTNDAVITFPTTLLHDKFDQFQFSLIVSSGDRKSSNAEMFLSISPGTNFRLLKITCVECTGSSVNWNKPFSVQAVCTDCSETDKLTFQWELFWINATEDSTTDVPFCRIKESMGAPSSLVAIHSANETSFDISNMQIASNQIQPTPISMEHEYTEDLSKLIEVPEVIHNNSENTESTTDVYLFESPELNLNLIEEGVDGLREGDSMDFDTHLFNDIKEGIGGSGTRTEGEIDLEVDFPTEDSGYNLVDLPNTAPPILPMIQWLKLPISIDVFNSYCTSGISSNPVSFKPFVLKPSKMYMLDVTLESNGKKVGRSQLYLSVHEMSQKITCQVQPRYGTEVFTIFSIFCTSGKEDLSYEFSYQVGNLSRKMLYKGRDIQYYFNLPSGDPDSGYQVTVFTQITNSFGSQTQPCPLNVNVHPVFSKNTSNALPEIELFQEGLRNLSILVLMGNHIEIRNYVVLLTTILNRLYAEDDETTFEQHVQIRNKLIFIVQALPFNNQLLVILGRIHFPPTLCKPRTLSVSKMCACFKMIYRPLHLCFHIPLQEELADIVLMVKELLNATNQVMPESVRLIFNFVKSSLKEREIPLKGTLTKSLITLVSTVMEVSSKWPVMKNIFMDGMDTISDLMLKHITLNSEQQFNLSTSFLELQTNIHENCQNYLQTIGPSTVHFPKLLDTLCRTHNTSAFTCYISQLMYFKDKEYFWGTLPFALDNGFTSLNLFDCRSKRKINNRNIVTPVTMEIDNRKTQNTLLNQTQFSLFRDKINFHHFNTTTNDKHAALRIMVTFHDTGSRTFPVLLLIRYSKKPTPLNFNFKQVHSTEENSTQIFIPADYLKDSGCVYLALMDADYKRHPRNNYISKILQYTLDIQWTQCLSWHNNQWNSEDCSTQKGTTTAMFICSCTRLGLYTTASRHVLSYFDKEDVSKFISTTKNPIPGIIVVLAIIFYILLMIFGKIKDQHEDQKKAYVFLQDNSPNEQQRYAIMVDIGFRSRPKSTTKVYIILHGEDGVSETRELYCPDRPLFERNSRNVFIMSVPDSLGPLWKIHIWHNNSGQSPSMYISHVIVKDLKSKTNFFFYAECWLAVDEGDGKVERELTFAGHGLGFRRLFYCKFTQYLEDFHSWGSVFSRPSYSWFSHTQRITTCLVMCLGYMCFNVILLYWKEDQYAAENGPIEISTTSLISGFQSTMVVYPIALLLSLLFRYSKKVNKYPREDHSKIKASNINCHQGQQHYIQEADTILQSSLAWHHFQYWAYDTWKKKYQRDLSTSSIHSTDGRRKHKSSCPSPTQNSTGNDDCSCNISHCPTPGLKNIKDCSNGTCLQQSSDLGLFDISFLHENKVLPPWCVYVAWSLCAVFSAGFGIVTVVIGIRFSISKCILWLHAVFLSMIYCIFILQPFLILLIAVFVAWRKKERPDFFVEALSEDVKYIAGEQYLQLPHLTTPSSQSSHDTSNFEKILAARKRARYLRLARPPTRPQLRIVRDKVRRKTVIKKIFRELTAYIVMTSVFVLITFGKYSNNEYLSNQAVRNEFIRNPVQLFNDIKTEDQWWNWSFNVLLDRLYWNNSYDEMYSNREAGPVEGNFFLTGAPIIIKYKSAHRSNQMISYFIRGNPFFTSSYELSKEVNYKPNTQKSKETLDQIYYQCGKIQCYKEQGSVISLGRLRTEAHSTLLKMRNQRWIERGTSALAVQFVLYNSPTNLFTMISLLIELPASGGIITSSAIDSLRIYRITSLMDYFIMAFEMVFLSMILVSFCIQLSTIIQKSIKTYFQDIWNCLEVSIIVFSLCYFISRFYYFMFVVDLIDHLQRGFFRLFINFSLIADYEKWFRRLHGIILFLMIIKLLKMLHYYRMMAPCIARFHLSCSNSTFIMLIGIVSMLCYSSLGHTIISSDHYPFTSVLQCIQTTFAQFLRIHTSKHINIFNVQVKCTQAWVAGLYGILFSVFILLWTGLLKGVLSSVAKYSKKVHRSKQFVTFKEVLSHARELIFSVVDRHRQKSTDSISIAGNNFYLDEFEDLIDELLFRLNAISDSLHHSLPAKSHSYTEEEDDHNNFDTCSNFSFKQAATEYEDGMQHEQLGIDTVTLGRGISCLLNESGGKRNQQQNMENVELGIVCNNLEDVQKRHNNNIEMNSKCLVKTEQENGLEIGKHASILRLPQEVHTKQTKDIHASVLQCDQIENRVRNESLCTSDSILHRDCKSLKHSYSKACEPLENSAMDFLGANKHTTRSVKLQDDDTAQQQHYICQASFSEMKMEKGTENIRIQSNLHSSMENKNMALSVNDSHAGGTSKPHIIRQCW